MPSSLLALAPSIVALVADRARELGRPITVLDVGVGRGKYGLLCREYLGDRLEAIDGIDAEPRYLAEAPWLEELYRFLGEEDIVDLVRERDFTAHAYDLVLMVDVFEHLDDFDAALVIRRLIPPVIISTPRDYFQNPEHRTHPTENHRSHWSAATIAAYRPLDREDVDALATFGAVLVRCAPLP